jgi:hypothetical protein
MIYRGSGFLAVVKFGFFPFPSPLPSVSKLDRRHTGSLRKRNKLLTGGGRVGRGAESDITFYCIAEIPSEGKSLLPAS